MPYTLNTALGPDWLWLADPSKPDVVWIVHRRTGLLVSAAIDLLTGLPQHEADAIAGSLRAAVIEGRHGEVSVLVERRTSGSGASSISNVRVLGGVRG